MGILDRLFSKKSATLPTRVLEPSLKAKSQLMTVKPSSERKAREVLMQADALAAVEDRLLESGKFAPGRVKDVMAGIKMNCEPFKPINALAVSKGRTFRGVSGDDLNLKLCAKDESVDDTELELFVADVCAHERHRAHNRYALMGMKELDVKAVEILSIPGVSCEEACRQTKAFPIGKVPPLPLKNCTAEMGHCRCLYRAVIPDFES